MIKKLLLIIFLVLFSSNANATMNEIKKIGLLVEYLSDRSCNVTKESIETTTKYIISNSRLKLSDDILYEPFLYIQPIVMESKNEDVCTGALVIFLKKSHNLKDGSYNRGDFIYYYNNTVILKSGKNRFKAYFTEALEEEIKKFVVEWSEDNK
ncbi:hypothetical protein OAO81_04970 [Candidatus Pelagibacter ubique]|nr:hypothetical protein [Candidatus Pelagibacter ubique]